jgi:hypothetical protein
MHIPYIHIRHLLIAEFLPFPATDQCRNCCKPFKILQDIDDFSEESNTKAAVQVEEDQARRKFFLP